MEIWNDIPEYEGIYQASTKGRIRTVEGKITSNKLYKVRCWKSRILKGRGDHEKTGKRVSLWKNGKRKDFLVARLVAMTFLGLPKKGETVNHKDGNRMNNEIENLEWLPLVDNIRHGFKTGLYSSISKKVILENENCKLEFHSFNEANRALGRNHNYISNNVKAKKNIVTSIDGTKYNIRLSLNEQGR